MPTPISLAVKFMLLGISGAAACNTVSAQDFPSKPIRIVTSEPGGPNDFVARIVAQSLLTNPGWQTIVENRGALLGAEAVVKAQPDGYTLLLASSFLWIGPLVQKYSYDPLKDFTPITILDTWPNVLVVHPSLPVKSVRELIALAKARPGALNYSSSGTGGSPHVAAELFKAMSDTDIVQVSYKGNIPTLNAVITGEVQMTFANAASGLPYIRSGRLKALAVASARPSTILPGLPTVASSGLPGYESAAMQGMLAPAKMSTTTLERLNQAIVRNIVSAEIKEKLFNAGAEIVGSSPDAFAATMKSEMSHVAKVIASGGIRVE